MQVKNYIVDNYHVLIDCLEEELCKNGIFYVRIDNEIHFQDKIVRFYDIDMFYKEIINEFFMKLNIEQIKKNESIKLIPVLEQFKPNDLILSENIINFKKEKNYNSMNKIKKRQESHKVKQQLKRYLR